MSGFPLARAIAPISSSHGKKYLSQHLRGDHEPAVVGDVVAVPENIHGTGRRHPAKHAHHQFADPLVQPVHELRILIDLERKVLETHHLPGHREDVAVLSDNSHPLRKERPDTVEPWNSRNPPPKGNR